MSQKPIDITYTEPGIGGVPRADVNLESIIGNITSVSSVPTWVPRLFKDSFAVYNSSGVRRFYWYDTSDNTWHYASGT